jgi:hypothetical protein
MRRADRRVFSAAVGLLGLILLAWSPAARAAIIPLDGGGVVLPYGETLTFQFDPVVNLDDGDPATTDLLSIVLAGAADQLVVLNVLNPGSPFLLGPGVTSLTFGSPDYLAAFDGPGRFLVIRNGRAAHFLDGTLVGQTDILLVDLTLTQAVPAPGGFALLVAGLLLLRRRY